MYSCLSLVSYFLLLNGILFGNINAKIGFQHGDFICPYLFIIKTKNLMRLLDHAENSSCLYGIKIARKTLAISHLLYVDELILLCRANLTELNMIQKHVLFCMV